MSRPSRGERGIALLITLLTLVLVMAIAYEIFRLGARAAQSGAYGRDSIRCALPAAGGTAAAGAALGAPVTEELFFRGLLTSRFGILVSSAVFGLMHFAYGSMVEVVGAFLIGIVLAATFKQSKSITPCILAHMAYNALAIAVMRLYA